MLKQTTNYSIKYWMLIGLGLLIFSSTLFFLLLLGSHMRMSGDDYCYNAVLAQKGLWKMQTHSYCEVSMFNGNRFSLTLFSGFFGLFPIRGSFLLITGSLMAWLAGIVVLLRQVFHRLGRNFSFLESLLFAEVFASFVLWSAPSLEQSFYWRSGMLPYFMPLVVGTWILVLVFWAGEKPNRRWLLSFIILLTSVVMGGFSETGAAFWFGFWALCLFSLLFIKWLWNVNLISDYGLPLGAALLGTVIATIFLALSPSTALRLASRPEPIELGSLLPLLGWNIKVYLWINLMRRTWMLLIPFIFGLGIGLWLLQSRLRRNIQKIQPAEVLKLLGVFCLVGFGALLLIAFVILPVTYIQSDYPPDRALIISQAVLTGAGITGGVLVIVLIDQFTRSWDLKTIVWNKMLWVVCLIFLSVSILAPVQIIRMGIARLPKYSRWSRLWDERHARLVEAGRNNAETIHVITLDHVIEDVGELAGDPGFWYNNCAEMYYGIDEIIADQAGW